MRLSEHIMMGSFVLQHQSGHAGDGRTTGCANQLAEMSIHGRCNVFGGIGNTYPWVYRLDSCPVCGRTKPALSIISMHLNDAHRWPLAKIADYVRSIEPPEPLSPETQREAGSSPSNSLPQEVKVGVFTWRDEEEKRLDQLQRESGCWDLQATDES